MEIYIPEWLLWVGGVTFAIIALVLMVLGAILFKMLWDESR